MGRKSFKFDNRVQVCLDDDSFSLLVNDAYRHKKEVSTFLRDLLIKYYNEKEGL